MKTRMFAIVSLLLAGGLVANANAQVMQLGRMNPQGRLSKASCECNAGGGGGLGGLLGKLHFGRSGGCAEPSCGMAGEILGASCGMPGPSCGMPAVGPSCGSTGLGYGGGFGVCGGNCDGCGVGGYFGRNLHQVNPCACGGSLLGDLARGMLCFVDRTVSCVVGGVFGGLRAATCHASGSFAALECAATACCSTCGDAGCTMGPSCGMASSEQALPAYDVPFTSPSQPVPHAQPIMNTPTPAVANPGTASPTPAAAPNPFMDDPGASMQRRSTVQRASFARPQVNTAKAPLRYPFGRRPANFRR